MTFPTRPDLRSARLGRLCGEAIRNRAARLALTLTVLAVWSGAALTVYATERDAAQASAAYTSAMLSDGYATMLITQSDNALERLAWPSCDTLRRHDSVRAVVGLREPVILWLWSAGGPEVPVREAMGDVARFLAITDPTSAGRWSASALVFDVDALGARPASGSEADFITRVVQRSGDGDTRTAVTANLTGFGGGFSGNAIMVAPAAGAISTCVVLADLDQRDEAMAAAAALFPVAEGFGQQWALTNAERFDSPRHRYEGRPSRWYWLGGVALVTLTWAFSLWILRGDLAVFSVAGLGSRQILGLVTAEMLILVLGAGFFILGLAAFDFFSDPDARASVLIGVREIARVAVASFGVCTAVSAAAAVAVSHRTLDALKDR